MAENLLEVKNVKKYFPITTGAMRQTIGQVKAVDDVSFTVGYGETLGIVGESGCGKSTVARMIMRTINSTEGRIIMDGDDITHLHGKKLLALRRKFQMVFQDPYASLNPKMSVGSTVAEPLIVNGVMSRREAIHRAEELLETVGLRISDKSRYPHEFSGGQRQRIGIARALALNPKLIVADEAVSALDVSIQAQILNLMVDLRKKHNLSYLFISHNLAVVRHISDRIGVMYLGHLVELADKVSFYQKPLHPYSVALLSAAPQVNQQEKRERIVLEGDVPSPSNPPLGCPFHTRCEQVQSVCKQARPALREIKRGHFVACHLY